MERTKRESKQKHTRSLEPYVQSWDTIISTAFYWSKQFTRTFQIQGWGKKGYVELVRIIKLCGEGRGWDGVSGTLKNQSIERGVSITFPFNSCWLVQKGCWYVDGI